VPWVVHVSLVTLYNNIACRTCHALSHLACQEKKQKKSKRARRAGATTRRAKLVEEVEVVDDDELLSYVRECVRACVCVHVMMITHAQLRPQWQRHAAIAQTARSAVCRQGRAFTRLRVFSSRRGDWRVVAGVPL
jgi:hypothetical protein